MPENTQIHRVNMVHSPATSIVFENFHKYYFYYLFYNAKCKLGQQTLGSTINCLILLLKLLEWKILKNTEKDPESSDPTPPTTLLYIDNVKFLLFNLVELMSIILCWLLMMLPSIDFFCNLMFLERKKFPFP